MRVCVARELRELRVGLWRIRVVQPSRNSVKSSLPAALKTQWRTRALYSKLSYVAVSGATGAGLLARDVRVCKCDTRAPMCARIVSRANVCLLYVFARNIQAHYFKDVHNSCTLPSSSFQGSTSVAYRTRSVGELLWCGCAHTRMCVFLPDAKRSKDVVCPHVCWRNI